jgi:hexosaminidase
MWPQEIGTLYFCMLQTILIMKHVSLFIFPVLILAIACSRPVEIADPDTVSIIPAPVNLEVYNGFFTITKNTVIGVAEGVEGEELAGYFTNWFEHVSGYQLERSTGSSSNSIAFALVDDPTLGMEGYQLEVTRKGVKVLANASAGLFYGLQSLLQMLPSDVFANGLKSNVEWKLPFCKIVDYPRFEWRGMHLDVSRHFFDVEFIKRYIDLIAMHKMNVFHWHLTDDNGWRVEIKKYPLLTGVSAWRVNREDMPWREVTPPEPGEEATYGGFYTQDDIREVIEYASERFITVIPEIEMPGHTSEVFAAYPELSCEEKTLFVQPGSYWPNVDIFCAGKEETFEFIENVLTEVVELFPAPYIHIGGDEATKVRWENCKKCQKRIKEEGLTGEDELQSWFIKRVERFVNRKGKKMIGWDEILEGGLAPEATVMSWRGEKGGIEAAEMGHDVIMCPTSHCYFDYYQAHPDFEPEAIGGFTTLKEVYHYEPVPDVLDDRQSVFIKGAQGNLWTEYIATPEHAEYMALPRMTALAEVVWSAKDHRDWESFQKRLQEQFNRFEAMNVVYSRGSWQVDIQPFLEDGTYTIKLSSEQINYPIYYTLDGTEPTITSASYSEPLTIAKSTVITAALFDNGVLMEYPSIKEIVFHPGIGKPVSLTNYPAKRYAAEGSLTLLDGLRGSENFQDGHWLGFEGVDLEAMIDLEERRPISHINIGFYQNTGAWIFLPETVTFTLLDDAKEPLSKIVLEPEATTEVKGVILEEFRASFSDISVRYISILARGMTTIPDWHEGAGNKGWIFADEIVIE